MSEIRVGDLVMVVRPTLCCKKGRWLGKPFVVHGFRNYVGPCSGCGAIVKLLNALGPKDEGFKYGIDVARLRKIDPPAELESVEHKEEQPA